MSHASPEGLKIAILLGGLEALQPETESKIAGLAEGLSERGHRPEIVDPREGAAAPRAEALLEKRGFPSVLPRIPLTVAELRRHSVDVVHAFTEADAVAGLLWRRVSHAPVTFTCVTPPTRESLADRRLRLTMATRAFTESDAVIAADDDVRRAIRRWLAQDVETAGPEDAAANEAIYRRCLASRARPAQT